MKKFFSYDAHCDDVHFFDTLEEARQHHIGVCEKLYDYFADSEGSAADCIDNLESGFYGEVHGYSTCERRKPTQAECDEVDRDFEVYVEPPVLTESVSDWIPCSDELPKIDSATRESNEVFFEDLDETIHHGWFRDGRSDEHSMYFIANLNAEIKSIDKVIRWMYVPS